MAPEKLSRKHLRVVSEGMNSWALVPKSSWECRGREGGMGAGDGGELWGPVSSILSVQSCV